ncbi:MAG: hypothetical protein JO080_00770 [Mucilaginibacter sp.]|nr:hypothetical protein [Mucilaginibacter sp.]
MKKLLSAAIIALFAISVNAQTPLTKELNCTEEAFTLRLDIRSGWRPGMVKVGNAQLANYAVIPLVDYFPINHNMQKPQVLGSSFFYPDGKPGMKERSLLFNKNSMSIFGLYNQTTYSYRDSVNYRYGYK